jgi:hypothetical protein
VPEQAEPVEVYEDSADGAGAVLSELDRAGAVAQDFLWLGAAVNRARLAVLGACSSGAGGWAIAGC